AAELGAYIAHTGDIAARPGQTGNELELDWIVGDREHDRDRGRRLLGGKRGIDGARDDDRHAAAHEVGGKLRQPVGLSVRPAILDPKVLSLAEARFPQAPAKGGDKRLAALRIGVAQKADDRHGRLLRPRNSRPRHRSPAEKPDDIAPPHSITSSARTRIVGGISRPSSLAVFRLTTSSNLAGTWTGNSLG